MNERLDDLIALAALGELDEREAAELEAAAAADPVVARSLASALVAAAALQATAREDPPAALRSSVLDAIANTRQEPAASTSWAVTPSDDQDTVATTSWAVAPSDQLPDTDLPGSVASIDQRRRSRRFAPLAVAAAALMLVAGGVIVATRNEPDSGGQVAAVVDAADVQTRTLDGALPGTLEVAYSASEDALALVGTDLPQLSDDETYQLWLVDPDGARSVGTFRPNDGVVAERFDEVDPSAFVVAVTREPAGGSDQPTLPILAAA